MVIALPRLQTATTKRCENASASVKLNYRSLPVGPRVVRMIDVSTYEGADFMGDRLRHVGSAVPRTSGQAEPKTIQSKFSTLPESFPQVNRSLTIRNTIQGLNKRQDDNIKKQQTLAYIDKHYPHESWIHVYTDG